MAVLTLVSHRLCPYVQRAAISLAEKRVHFERLDVDLSKKPDWFRAVSPLGKVPLLKVPGQNGEEVIFESAVILEYLEETQPNPLHPDDPLERARHRSWIEFGSALLNGIARLYNAKERSGFRIECEKLRGGFDRLEQELQAPRGGPYFGGSRFTLVDAVYAPVFRYFDVFEARGDLRLLDGLSCVSSWRAALSERHSVRQAVDRNYPELLRTFLRDRNSYMSGLIK